FKRFVLDFALAQVNEFTDIKAKYEQYKMGRTITGFSFTFKSKISKTEITSKNKNAYIDFTQKQLDLFAHKLARLPELSHLAVEGQSYEDFEKPLKEMLKSPEKQKGLIKFLEKVGYKP